MLAESPGAEGQYTVKLTATDSDPDCPQSNRRPLVLKVGPADPATLLIKKAAVPPPREPPFSTAQSNKNNYRAA